jgi:uncharacterized membrane protein YvbJ
MATKCPSCGFKNPESQKFCGECGVSLSGPLLPRAGLLKCPNCGFDNPEGKRFCVSCGSMISRPPKSDTPKQVRKE